MLIDSHPVPSSLQPLPVSALRLFCLGAAQHHCWTRVPHDCKGAFENMHPSYQVPKEELQQHPCLETSPGATQLCARWCLCKPARAPHRATTSRLQGTPGCSFLPPCPCLSLPFLFIIFGCAGSLFLHGLFSSCSAWGLLSSCGVQALLMAASSLVAEHGLESSGSVVVAHRLSCSVAYGNFTDRESNAYLLHWQADSLPLSCQGSPPFLCSCYP